MMLFLTVSETETVSRNVHQNYCWFVGRLSKEEIEKMVREAERYKEEDDKQRDRLQAKNALESYAFNMKQTIEDDKLKDKISNNDRKTVLDKCNEVIQWIDGNQVHQCVTVMHVPMYHPRCIILKPPRLAELYFWLRI